MVSGLAGWRPRPGMTSFLDFPTPSFTGVTEKWSVSARDIRQPISLLY
jgi:hypothetical protein